MIKCNLAVLLAERNLRISKVSEDTGISRTTLTALSNNYSQGIQFDTLNKLCLHLQVTPDKMFAYLPFDYRVSVSKEEPELFAISIAFHSKAGVKTAELYANAYADYDRELSDEDDPHSLPVKILTGVQIVLDFYADDSAQEDEQLLTRYLSVMPAIFRTDIEDTITSYICDELRGDAESPELDCSFAWPVRLT